MRKIIYGLGILIALSLGLFNVSSVQAHGFGERYDLPIPLGFFLVGASLTIIISFVVIGIFLSYTHKSRNFVPTRTVPAYKNYWGFYKDMFYFDILNFIGYWIIWI